MFYLCICTSSECLCCFYLFYCWLPLSTTIDCCYFHCHSGLTVPLPTNARKVTELCCFRERHKNWFSFATWPPTKRLVSSKVSWWASCFWFHSSFLILTSIQIFCTNAEWDLYVSSNCSNNCTPPPMTKSSLLSHVYLLTHNSYWHLECYPCVWHCAKCFMSFNINLIL